MENSIIQRIAEIITSKGFSENSFAKQIGSNQRTINQQLRGDRKLSLDTVCNVISSFGDISAEWLLRGEGNMNKSEEKNSDIHIMYETSRKQILLRDERIRDLEIELELANTRCEELKKEVLALIRGGASRAFLMN